MALSNYLEVFQSSPRIDVKVIVESEDEQKNLSVYVCSEKLKAMSPVLKRMIESDSFEEGRTGVLKLKIPGDMHSAIAFVGFMKTNEIIEIRLDDYVTLLVTGDSYDIPNLVKLCEEKILEGLTPRTMGTYYEKMKDVASETFRSRCESMLLEFAFLIFMENRHLLFREETMTFLLKADNLRVLNEEQALCAVWTWCHFQSAASLEEIESRVLPFLHFIRGQMIPEVNENVHYFHLYSKMKDALSNSTNARKPENTIPLTRFSKQLKLPKTMEIGTYKDYSYLETLKVKVSQDIILVGVSILFLTNNPGIKKISLYLGQKEIGTSGVGDTIKYSCDKIAPEYYQYSIACELNELTIIERNVMTDIRLEFTTIEIYSYGSSKSYKIFEPEDGLVFIVNKSDWPSIILYYYKIR